MLPSAKKLLAMSAGTILIADDDSLDVALLEHAFNEIPLHNPIRVVKNGVEVISYFSGDGKYANRDEFPLPFLLVLDWNMPLLGGLEVLSWIRKQPRFYSLLVIVLTGSIDPAQKRAAFQAGANWHLVKSVDFRDVQILLFRIRDFWTHRFSPRQTAFRE